MRMMIIQESDAGILGKKKSEIKTFRLLVRMLYQATGDSWELRPLN